MAEPILPAGVLSIFIPAYNEEKILDGSIARVVRFLEDHRIQAEILLVDNCSTDRTGDIALELARKFPQVRYFRTEQRGVGRAFKTAVRNARHEYIVCLDADLSSELVFIRYSLDLLPYCDLLIGSKAMGMQHRSWIRAIGSQLYILFTQMLMGTTVSDFSPGTKAFRRSSILSMLEPMDPWTGYVIESYLFLKIRGKKVLQIGVDCNDRRRSRFNLFHEGYYRYRHLFHCWKWYRDPSSWFYGR
jgi:glycosyltransferase involved in cell wall biosynthesis